MSKRVTKSRTIKFNAVVIALATAALAFCLENDELIKQLLSPAEYLALLIGVALVNAWLRTKTTTGIRIK